MKDPVSYALELTGTKPTDLAKQLEISKQYISRAQLGCHVNLNKRLIQWIQISTAKEFDQQLSRSQVRNWYETFKLKKRQDSFDRIKPELISYRLSYIPKMRVDPELITTLDTLELPESFPESFPEAPVANFSVPDFRTKFIEWRKSYWSTTYRFASDMCIHPASVDNYEEGKVQGIPGDLKTILDWMWKYTHDN